MIVAPFRKFDPETVSVKVVFTWADEGDRPLITGVGGVAAKFTVLELDSPGFKTATGTFPAVPGTVTDAVSDPAFTNVVVTKFPLNKIAAPLRKFEPETVSVNVVLIGADDGDRPLITGGGGVPEVAVKKNVFEVKPPGFTTVTGTFPAGAGTVTLAVSALALTNVVATALPLNRMVAPLTKLDPVTVKVSVVSTVPDAGERPVTTGAAPLTVKEAAFEGPPPGPRFVTTTEACPGAVSAGMENVIVVELTKLDETVVPLTET
jgi:hypothetical protein